MYNSSFPFSSLWCLNVGNVYHEVKLCGYFSHLPAICLNLGVNVTCYCASWNIQCLANRHSRSFCIVERDVTNIYYQYQSICQLFWTASREMWSSLFIKWSVFEQKPSAVVYELSVAGFVPIVVFNWLTRKPSHTGCFAPDLIWANRFWENI